MVSNLVLGILLTSAALHAQTIGSYYTIEAVPGPADVTPLLGGLTFTPDGRLVACFHHGEIAVRDSATKQWTVFAEGLHEPLGIIALSNTQFVVCQRPEVTRITDTDGDGKADLFENLTDAFGQSRNYHEFNFGPARDAAGNLYFITSPASAGSGVAYETRGKYNPDGRDLFQDYSPVPFRGWCWKLSPDGVATPYASGFRQANGLGFDLDGNLFATDNQGAWIGSSKLLHIHPGLFHGFAMARVWERGWPGGNPLSYPVEVHDHQRVREAVMFPHGSMANSPSQPLVDSNAGQFGPFAGQLLIGEMNRQRIVRVALEKIGGELQGMCVPFFDADGLQMGNVRLAWAPDHSLYVAHTMRQGWAGDSGIQRIAWTGKTPPEVLRMNLTDKGFDITFTVPVDPTTASLPGAYKFRRSYYRYHRRYDARQFDVHDVATTKVTLSADHRTTSVELEEMVPGRVYELNLAGVKSESGAPIVNPFMAYTLNRLLDGTPGYQPPAFIFKQTDGTIEAERAQELAHAQVNGDHVALTQKDAAIETWVHLPKQGMYDVTIRYATDGTADSTLRWFVNGRNAGAPRVFKATKGAWQTLVIKAIFDEGDNALGLQHIGKGNLRIDRFDLSYAQAQP